MTLRLSVSSGLPEDARTDVLIPLPALDSLEMSPPPTAALALLGLWILVVFAATNAAAYSQWWSSTEVDPTADEPN